LGLSVNDAAESLALINDALGKRKTEAGEKSRRHDHPQRRCGAFTPAIRPPLFLKGCNWPQMPCIPGWRGKKLNELIAFTDCIS